MRSPEDLLKQIAQVVDELAGDGLQATAVNAPQALDASDTPRAADASAWAGLAASDLGTNLLVAVIASQLGIGE
jgi:hypothetical protein